MSVKIIKRRAATKCEGCEAFRCQRDGVWNISPFVARCVLGFKQDGHAFGAKPAEPCPRPRNDDELFDAEQLVKSPRPNPATKTEVRK